MFISKSNAILGRTPNVTTGASSDLPSNMTTPDFSVNYTSSGERLVMSFGAVFDLDYVAVCASNLGVGGQITARNGTSSAGYNSIRGQYITERDHVCMFNFERETFSNLIIVVDSNDIARRPIVSFVAAGKSIQVPNGGENAGYDRNWQTRSAESRVVSNSLSAPVANLKKSTALSGNLTLPNMRTDFMRTEWQEFIDFASSEPFFICEQENIVPNTSRYEDYRDTGGLPESSYICYQPRFQAPKAHSATRALQNLSIRFNCYNGL